ncbi:MAG: hypothetical protein ABSB79_01935 [Syntrophales bacterium]
MGKKMKAEKGYKISKTAINPFTGEKVPIQSDSEFSPEALKAMKEALKKPKKIGDITEVEISDLMMQTNLTRIEAIHAIIYQRMYESKIISERARKSASAPRGSNWFNTLLGQMTKKHPAWGWKEICAALEKKALKNSNVNNSIYEVDDEYVIWTDQR